MLLLVIYFINDTIWFYKWYEKIKVYILKSCFILSKLRHDFPHVISIKKVASISIIVMEINEHPVLGASVNFLFMFFHKRLWLGVNFSVNYFYAIQFFLQ